MSRHPRSIFGPLLLIAAGTVWLLTKSGNIPTANLWALTHIWPYVLIAAGVGLILRSYWKYASVLLDVVIIGGAVFSIMNAPQLGWDTPSVTTMFFDNHIYVGASTPGSGKVVTQTREVKDFSSIEMDYFGQVTVTQGNTTSVKVEAEDNVLPGLQTRVKNNTLEIFYKVEDGEYVRPTKPVKIAIVVKDLKNVDFGSAGDVTISGLEADNLDISVSGAGNLKLSEITVKDLSVVLSGAGNVNASGEADNLKLTISGVGSFNGKELHNKTARVTLSGAGGATVWVDDELSAQVSGVGSINYYGSPSVDKQVSGVGGVSRSGDK